jgi:hypothetical protein
MIAWRCRERQARLPEGIGILEIYLFKANTYQIIGCPATLSSGGGFYG